MSVLKLYDGSIQLDEVNPIIQNGKIQYYAATITIKELYQLKDRLIYDSESQRGEVNGKKMIDEKHVNQIYESFIEGNGVNGQLIWNMRESDDELIEYNFEKRTLIIPKSQLITLPDSAHRHMALYKVAELSDVPEELESQFQVSIYNLDFEQEKHLFYTINGKTKKPNNNRTLYLSNELTSKLLRDVINESKLKGRIEFVTNSATSDGILTKFSTLHDSLFSKAHSSYGVNCVNEDNYEELKTWLVNFYNGLLESRLEFEYKTSKEKQLIKQDSMILEEITWWGYGLLAKNLQGDRNWKSKLKNKMNKDVSVIGGNSLHFLDKSLPIWHATVIKPKYNYITKTQEPGVNVTNNNSTRSSLMKIFNLTLFNK